MFAVVCHLSAAKGFAHMGKEALERIVTHPLLENLPFYMETPNEAEGYRREIAMVRNWRAQRQ